MKHLVVGNTEYGVPQGSILGPLCDLFDFPEDLDIASYADYR